jgi:ribosome-associated translation inhibitor RaiA
VVVELEGHHHRKGDRYRFAINLGLPGHEFVVTRGPSMGTEDESPYQSADKAFDEAARQIKDWERRRRGHRHEELDSRSARRIE